MASVLTSALLDPNQGGLNRRKDVLVMDTSATSLPAASVAAPTVDGIPLQTGDKVLYTALTTGANAVYTLHHDSVNGTFLYWFAPTTSPLYSSDARAPFGAPTQYDVILVQRGTSAGALMMWTGSAWVAQDIATAASVAAAVTAGTAPASGTTGARPVAPATGYMYFDTTLGQPVWWDGTGYVDATGTTA